MSCGRSISRIAESFLRYFASVKITFDLLHYLHWIGLGEIKLHAYFPNFYVIFNIFISRLLQVNTAKINLLEVAENIKARRRANKRLSEQMAEKVCVVCSP